MGSVLVLSISVVSVISYMAVNDQLYSWADAETQCQMRYNTHLATIRTSGDDTNAYALCYETDVNYFETSKTSCWIGLNELDTFGEWRWISDGTLASYTNWAATEPSRIEENCAGLIRSQYKVDEVVAYKGEWNDMPCTGDRIVICDANFTSPPTTKEPTTQDPTTNEPTTDDPTTDDPTTDDPTTDDPTTDEPTTNSPTTNDPTTNEPTTDDSTTTDITTTDDTTTNDSTTDDPATDDPTTEPTTDEPTTDEPTTDDSTTDGPTTDGPTDDPTTDDPTAGDGTADEPLLGLSSVMLLVVSVVAACLVSTCVTALGCYYVRYMTKKRDQAHAREVMRLNLEMTKMQNTPGPQVTGHTDMFRMQMLKMNMDMDMNMGMVMDADAPGVQVPGHDALPPAPVYQLGETNAEGQRDIRSEGEHAYGSATTGSVPIATTVTTQYITATATAGVYEHGGDV